MAKSIAPRQYQKALPSVAETQAARLQLVRESEGLDLDGADDQLAHHTASYWLGDTSTSEC